MHVRVMLHIVSLSWRVRVAVEQVQVEELEKRMKEVVQVVVDRGSPILCSCSPQSDSDVRVDVLSETRTD